MTINATTMANCRLGLQTSINPKLKGIEFFRDHLINEKERISGEQLTPEDLRNKKVGDLEYREYVEPEIKEQDSELQQELQAGLELFLNLDQFQYLRGINQQINTLGRMTFWEEILPLDKLSVIKKRLIEQIQTTTGMVVIADRGAPLSIHELIQTNKSLSQNPWTSPHNAVKEILFLTHADGAGAKDDWFAINNFTNQLRGFMDLINIDGTFSMKEAIDSQKEPGKMWDVIKEIQSEHPGAVIRTNASSSDSIADPFHQKLQLKTVMPDESSYLLPKKVMVPTGDYEKAFGTEINDPQQYVTVLQPQEIDTWLKYKGLELDNNGRVVSKS